MPGALEKMVKLPFGEMPAGVALNIAIMDVVTHASDIADAPGQDIDDEEILPVAVEVGHQLISDDLAGPGSSTPRSPPFRTLAADRSWTSPAERSDGTRTGYVQLRWKRRAWITH